MHIVRSPSYDAAPVANKITSARTNSRYDRSQTRIVFDAKAQIAGSDFASTGRGLDDERRPGRRGRSVCTAPERFPCVPTRPGRCRRKS
jgi:hypothetical protein